MLYRKLCAFGTSTLLALFFLFVQAADATSFSGRVVAVADGDTIQVMHDGKAEKIRLNGIDCPESHQAFGQKAKQFASDMVFGKTVVVEVRDRDKYGRTVGDVLLSDGRSLNRALVREGFAWWYQQYSRDQTLRDLENEARAAKRGLWADASSIAPWDFRHGKKGATSTGVGGPGGSLSERLVPSAAGRSISDNSSRLSERLAPSAESTGPVASSLSERLRSQPSASLVGLTQRDQTGITVYITKTGKKYHQEGCRYLSKSAIPLPLTDAKTRGFGPCSVCDPPL